MADGDNKSSGPDDSGLWVWIVIIFILLGLGESLNRTPSGVLSSGSSENQSQQVENTNNDPSVDKSFITKVFPKGVLSLDSRVMMLETQNIRRSVGGGIIGKQLKRSKGYLKEGPIIALGREWVRIDFDDAPDGWVDKSFLTAKIKAFTIFNIIPIIFSHIRIIAFILTLILLIALGYIKVKENNVNKLASKKKQAELDFSKYKHEPDFDNSKVINKQWENVMSHMNSANENDWRQAIIEADIMLDSMLTKIGYDGDTVAEKLKNVEENDFVTLNKAWEAHKIRNRIAHDGSKFKINREEAERVIDLFEQVFKEFYYI